MLRKDVFQKKMKIIVRLQLRIVKKSYKKGLRVYKHEEVTLSFPEDLHGLLKVICDKKFEIKGRKEGNKILLVLSKNEES
jgi:hypothetical protein